MLDDGETTGADVLERSLGVGSRLLGASVRGTCSWPVLPVDESCAPDRAAYASAHICWAGSDRSRARTRDVCRVCHVRTLYRVLSGSSKAALFGRISVP